MFRKKMLGKFFNKRKPTENRKATVFEAALADAKTKNPLAGLQLGAEDLIQRLLAACKTEQGVHIESFLAILASLAGFSCQMALREKSTKAAEVSEQHKLIEVTTNSGEKYYFGDSLNQPLLETEYSVWSLAAGAAQSVGCSVLPNIHEIVEHSASTLGGEGFGIPRLPAGHEISDLPVNYVRNFWQPVQPFLQKYCDTPAEWPLLLGLAVQKAIIMGKDAIDPKVALIIVMECAVPASKYDPAFLRN